MKTLKCLILLLLCCGILFGCSGIKVTADISDYEDIPIRIIGLAKEDFEITPGELADMKCVKMSASGETAKAGNVSSVGPLLSTFVEAYGKKLSDFKMVRFIASDEYRVTFIGENLLKYKIVMSVANDDSPLAVSMRPMRLLVPEAESSRWIYAVVQIEFIPVDNP